MISVITTTLSKGKIFRKLRKKLDNLKKSNNWKTYTLGNFLNDLFHCPYCLSHWLSLFVSIYFFHRFFNWFKLEFLIHSIILYTFVLVALSSLPTFLLIKYLKWLDTIE
jgi:hypothetical protein